MKVVILARVSTANQDFERQTIELTAHCKIMNWEIVNVFANKTSGAKKNSERSEILELIEFVKNNQIDKVLVLEISRLGRNTLEALRIIQLLNESGICLYIKNYNLETLDKNGKPNPITSLICTILLEISSMERLTIAERMTSGRKQYIQKCKNEGVKMGRPDTYRKSDETMRIQYSKEIQLLKKEISLRNIHAITGTSIVTIRKLNKFV